MSYEETMTSEEWKEKYVATLVREGHLERQDAEKVFKAGAFDEQDYLDDPEDAARCEMSYWEPGEVEAPTDHEQ